MRDEPRRGISRNAASGAYGRHAIRSSTPDPSSSAGPEPAAQPAQAPPAPASSAPRPAVFEGATAPPNLPRGSAASDPLEPGDPRRIGHYEVLTRLGIGGMGTVYLGRDGDGALAAIKLVHAHLAVDTEFRARFRCEVQAGRRVPPFCSARVLGSGDHEGRPYLITEYIDGVPLSQLVAEDGPLSLPNLHALALGTAAGLAAIHGTDLVHRDVKPSNIIMTLGGVRIIDFGIARALDDTAEYTRSGVVMGSLGWAAPEQLSGEPPSPAMDVFGWGCVVGFAATGDHPFGGTDLNTRAWRVLHGEPDASGVPDALRPLVEAALNRRPEHRPTTRELLLALVDAVSPGGAGPAAGAAGPAASDAGAGSLDAAGEGVAGGTPLRTGSRPRKTFGALAAAAPLALAIVIGAAGGTQLGGGHAPGDAPPGGEVPAASSGPPGSPRPFVPEEAGATRRGGGGGGGEQPSPGDTAATGASRGPVVGTATTVIVEPTTDPPASPAPEVTKKSKTTKPKPSNEGR